MAGVTIGLLGGFSASAGGEAVPDGAWRLKKARELVKLLALARGHRLHREQAMDALWPDLDPGAAANNLNQAVHVARKALGTGAIEGRDGLLMLVAEVDVERFEEAAAAALRARSVQAARAALALYGGELLPENRYDDFAAAPREELEALADELSRVLDGDGGRFRLPADASSFVGRRHELAELKALLGHGRLLTLTGTGGAGKTRLALELARSVEGEFADGAAFVELAPVAVPSRVVGAVAAAFDLQPLPGQALEEALVGLVAPRELLLVLDNCEHVLEASATLAGALLRTSPRLTLLVTTREPLRLPGEMVFRVPSLGIPDPEHLPGAAELAGYESVSLFVERAAAVAPGFTLDDGNAADVARICFRLDGLPLALELAAGRVGGLSPAAIAARLDDRFRLLRAGASHAPTRQQTLEATLRWSQDLLEPDERVLFRRLGVFAGGFELGAAEAVCSGDLLGLPEVADVLGRLVEKSLVSVEDRGPDRRYRLLETVRLYAREQLSEAGEARALAAGHAYWALALAEAVRDTPALDREASNMRAALDTLSSLDPQGALRLCTALMPFWVRRIDLEEAQRRFAEALEAAPEHTLARADALLAASAVGLRSGACPAGLRGPRRASRSPWPSVIRAQNGARSSGSPTSGSAWDDGETAMRYLERALALARREGFSGAEALGVYTLGVAHWLIGEPDEAEACLDESLELFRALAGSPERILSPLNINEVRFAGVQGVLGPRLVFEETLQPFMEMSSRRGGRLRAREPLRRSPACAATSGGRAR